MAVPGHGRSIATATTTTKGTVCVTGAAGFIGSWLVMKLLERGYNVRATVRDPSNKEKVKHLLELPNASTRLSLWKADLNEEGSFDDAIQCCSGVFHVAASLDFMFVKDPENDYIKPTVDGLLNVMRSCEKAKSTLNRIVYTSSLGTMDTQPQPPLQYDETLWTDVDFCRANKIFPWVYLVAKTEAEKAAWKFAQEKGLGLLTLHPSSVNGPFLTPSKPTSAEVALALITKNKSFYPMLKQGHAVHVDDVCNAHIYLYEHPQAKGRYICSSHSFTIFDLASSLSKKYPEYNIQTKFEGYNESAKPIPCPSKKLMDLGFKFKYNSEEYDTGDLFAEAVKACKEKGQMPHILNPQPAPTH